jgi:TRAP-type uncharacterized transport system substrate-binding protein
LLLFRMQLLGEGDADIAFIQGDMAAYFFSSLLA